MANATLPIGTFSGIRFFDEDDFMSFGGAEPFAFGGQPPVIYENSDRLIVAGRNGVEVMFGDHECDHYVLAREQMTMCEAIAVIEMISHASRIAMKAVGFTIGR
jgi:hypothetical protein